MRITLDIDAGVHGAAVLAALTVLESRLNRLGGQEMLSELERLTVGQPEASDVDRVADLEGMLLLEREAHDETKVAFQTQARAAMRARSISMTCASRVSAGGMYRAGSAASSRARRAGNPSSPACISGDGRGAAGPTVAFSTRRAARTSLRAGDPPTPDESEPPLASEYMGGEFGDEP